MALIVEDGSIVANANSYVDFAYIDSYDTVRGEEIPADPAKEQYAIIAMDIIESFADQFKGVRYTKDQALQWPRSGVYIDGYLYGETEIPEPLKMAQAQLIIELNNGVKIFPDPRTNSLEGVTIEKGLTPLRKRFSSRVGLAGTKRPTIPAHVGIHLSRVLKTSTAQPIVTR